MGRVRAQEAHNPGAFKQQNKIHKTGRHRSKGQIAVLTKGRANVGGQSGKKRRHQSREARRNRSSQIRSAARAAVLQDKRRLGTADSPPFLTALVSLAEDVLPELVLALLSAQAGNDAVASDSMRGLKHVSVARFKQRFSFVLPHDSNLFYTLDSLKVADSVILVWPADGILSEEMEGRLSALKAGGLPATLNVVYGQSAFKTGSQPKRKIEALKRNFKDLFSRWSMEGKYFELDKESDVANLYRQLGVLKRTQTIQQQRRSFVLAENVERTELGELAVDGYIRGAPLDVNGLVHFPGFGDFQLSAILSVTDPHPLLLNPQKEAGRAGREEPPRVLEEADPDLQESLQSEVVPDPLDAEQTWPDQDDTPGPVQEEPREKKKVPKGTSEYQAAWIVESDDESGDEDDETDASEDGMSMEDEEESEEDEEVGADGADSMSVSEGPTDDYDNQLDLDEERRLAVRFREERENAEFPDEVDTPLDQAARVRFQKYRGLKSFRSSPWDPKENLPLDYARIFQFANFKATKKRVLKEERTGAQHGWYVRVLVKDPTPELLAFVKDHPKAPLVLCSLLRHEGKMSLVNAVIRRWSGFSGLIKAKDSLLFHIGHRRFTVAPLLSAHSTGDKHKMERWLPGTDAAVVASFFAPITFPPAPVLVFTAPKEDGSGGELVATGSLLDMNPNRIVLKRIALSGAPFRFNARSAVVRHMFFNRDDVLWFKPVELKTKYGRRGHIKEALGTHGHMKCTFEGRMNSQDTVMLNLYKRVFPKWNYSLFTGPLALAPPSQPIPEEQEMES